jgi:guanylate kinase
LQNYYGYKRDLEQRANRGENVVIHGLSRMALRMSQDLPDTFLVFLLPSSNELLETRLAERNYDNEQMAIRRAHWAEEMEHSSLYTWVLRDGDRTPTETMAELLADIVSRFR